MVERGGGGITSLCPLDSPGRGDHPLPRSHTTRSKYATLYETMADPSQPPLLKIPFDTRKHARRFRDAIIRTRLRPNHRHFPVCRRWSTRLVGDVVWLVRRDAPTAYDPRAAATILPQSVPNPSPGLCLCGCKKRTVGALPWWVSPRLDDSTPREDQNHSIRLDSRLDAIERGWVEPADVLGEEVAEALGPWTEIDGGGKIPTRSYREIRR